MENVDKRILCAIYTRVSTEEQARSSDFSSLDNQRESCEDFIKSQNTTT